MPETIVTVQARDVVMKTEMVAETVVRGGRSEMD